MECWPFSCPCPHFLVLPFAKRLPVTILLSLTLSLSLSFNVCVDREALNSQKSENTHDRWRRSFLTRGHMCRGRGSRRTEKKKRRKTKCCDTISCMMLKVQRNERVSPTKSENKTKKGTQSLARGCAKGALRRSEKRRPGTVSWTKWRRRLKSHSSVAHVLTPFSRGLTRAKIQIWSTLVSQVRTGSEKGSPRAKLNSSHHGSAVLVPGVGLVQITPGKVARPLKFLGPGGFKVISTLTPRANSRLRFF